jgi:virulence factor Mce-like protein
VSPARAIAYAAGGVLAIVVAAMLLSGGSTPYRLTMVMDNADGLAQGSAVNIGGVPVGTVTLGLDHASAKVLVTLNIDRSGAPVGRDATAAVVAQNVLGQKQVELSVGDRRHPAPSGYQIPPAHISVTTDLDQVMQVLDPSTRARLAVLVNEAGIAFTGRELDLRQLLGQAPDSVSRATELLGALDSDNQALSDLLARSDRYVAETTSQRSGLEHLVDRVGQTAQTVATERVALRQGLADAPGFLRSARVLLARLQSTAPRLDTAARELTQTASPLSQTLAQVAPFTHNAAPALDEAVTAAPQLERLALGATPVLRKAGPVLSNLDDFTSATLPPIFATLGGSIDNTLSVVQNWARAIQFRDHLSHIFRGEASFAPDELNSALARLTALLGGGKNGAARRRLLHRLLPTVAPAPSRPSAPTRGVTAPLSGVASALQQVTQNLGGAAGSAATGTIGQTQHLLNYLLGR